LVENPFINGRIEYCIFVGQIELMY
jgi:hypothetical protein